MRRGSQPFEPLCQSPRDCHRDDLTMHDTPLTLPDDWAANLLEIAGRRQPLEETCRQLSRLTAALINAQEVNWLSRESIEALTSGDATDTNSSRLSANLLGRLSGLKKATIVGSPEGNRANDVLIPVASAGVLHCRLVASPAQLPQFVALLKLIAGYFLVAGQAAHRRQLEQFAIENGVKARLNEVLFQSDDPRESMDEFCQVVAQHLKADIVVMMLAPDAALSRRVALAGSNRELEKRGETVRLARKLAAESMTAPAEIQTSIDSQGVCPSAHAQLLASEFSSQRMLALAVNDALGQPQGALLIGGNQLDSQALDSFRRWLISLGPSLLFRHRPRSTRGPVWRPLHRKLALAVATGALVALMWVPIPYQIRTPLKLVPQQRRVVTAPFDGVLLSSPRQSGDSVERGSELGAMDEGPLQLEYRELSSERIRVAKQRDVKLAEGQIGDVQMADIRLREIDAALDLIDLKLARARIEAPIDGILIGEDLKNAEGAQVSLGQPLYEVAPLEQLRAELEVAGDQVGQLSVGQPVQLWVDQSDAPSIKGQVTRIAPRAEVREGRNVILCEVLLDNSDRQYRPGMQGKAAIEAGYRSVGWLVFHRLWDKTRVYLGV